MADTKSKRGRPSSYTPEIAASICERIASGETLVAICKSPGIPSISTILGNWLDAQPEFAQLYTRAKQVRLDVMAEEITHLADECRQGVKEKRTQTGWQCPKCDIAVKWRGNVWVHVTGSLICDGVKKPDPVYEVETQTGDMVDRSKLQVDTRKWLLSKLAAKTYGDRLELAGDKDNPLQTRVVIEVVDSPAQIAGVVQKQLEGGE